MDELKSFAVALLLAFSFSAFGQTSTRDYLLYGQKNQDINLKVYDVLTSNDTLTTVEQQKSLLFQEETDWDVIKDIPKDTWALLKAPAGWSKKQWIIASGAVSIATMLMVGDKHVQNFFQKYKTEFTNSISHIAEMGGSQNHIALGATYLIGTILKNPKLKRASVLAFSSLLISGVLVQGSKALFGRNRPYAANNQWEFHGPTKFKAQYASFPSGHTAAAFAVASSISTVYDSPLVKVLAYTAATLTGLSRVHDNKHWMSDVFMGAILGTASGIFITKRHLMNPETNRISISPTVITTSANNTAYGVSVSIKLGGKKKPKRKRSF
jgi:hypothetical protein